MFGKITARFKALSRVGKLSVVGAGALAMVTLAGVSADQPAITSKDTTASVSIPFATTFQDDDSLLTSESKVVTPGANGSKRVTYKVTYKGTQETERKVLKESVQTAPTDEVKAKGTKEIVSATADEAVPFGATSVTDPGMSQGTSKITTAGVNGTKTVTYEITKIRGQEISRNPVSEKVIVAPVNQVTSVGTKIYCANGSYVNTYGNTICSPSSSASGASAKCRDGSFSYSQSRSGTCSHHGGVATWL